MPERVILTVRAAWPTAGPALAFRKILRGPPNMLGPSLYLLWSGHPADPFVARERRDVSPSRERLRAQEEAGLEVRRQPVHDAAGNGWPAHVWSPKIADHRAAFSANESLACAGLVEGRVVLAIANCDSIRVGSTCRS